MPRPPKAYTADDWANAQTLLGTTSDKTSQTAYQTRGRLSDAELDALYEENALAARIIDRLPDDATREDFIIKDANEEFDKERLDSILEDLEVMTALGDTWRWGRLYGGALTVLAINDGRPFEAPLDMKNITGISSVNVIDRRWAFPRIWEPGLGSRSFANPKHYDIFVSWGRGEPRQLHSSRAIRFDGMKINEYSLIKTNGWGPSVLQRVYSTLKRLGTNRKSTEHIILHLSMFMYGMEGLRKVLKQGKAAKKNAEEYFATIREAMDTLHMLVFDKNDTFSEKPIGNLSGLVALLERSLDDLVSETDMPRSILLGETPGGLNTGENAGETRAWFDYVRAQQRKILTAPINRILEIIFAMWKRAGMSVPTKWTIDYKPLWQLNEKEQSEIRTANAQADNTYWLMGALGAQEIRRARFIDGETGDIELTEEEAAEAPETVEPATAQPTPEGETEAPAEEETDNYQIVRDIPKGVSLLQASEVAERLGCAPSTVIKMAKKGQIRSFKMPNGRFRFNWEEVAEELGQGYGPEA
jgi:phage-related protein (TIGR01555 family)